MHDTTTTTVPAPQPTRRRALSLALLTALLAPFLLLAGVEPAGAQGAPRFQFVVRSFTAIDETGADFAGSDEIYVKAWDHTRTSYGSGHVRTSTYLGVDTGESRTVKHTENCVSANRAVLDKNGNGNLNGSQGDQWACQTGDAGFGSLDATVSLYDQETFGDQLIGSKAFKLSALQLTQLMPAKGDFEVLNETFSNGGKYQVTFVIQRVQ